MDNSEMNIDRLELLVQNEETVSHLSILAAIGTVDSIMSSVPNSPDNLSIAIGYLERFVQIGDAIAKVSESSFDFIMIINLLAGSPLCQTCVEHTNRSGHSVILLQNFTVVLVNKLCKNHCHCSGVFVSCRRNIEPLLLILLQAPCLPHCLPQAPVVSSCLLPSRT
jgi:hypothetical protein